MILVWGKSPKHKIERKFITFFELKFCLMQKKYFYA
uniref:Uncharacterized protein n=1 Tax=Ciona intestinalis TaxID=7719 RepID=H2Y357_CIOIN